MDTKSSATDPGPIKGAVARYTKLLAKTDPSFKKVMGRHVVCEIGETVAPSKRFSTLARSIVHQQLAGKAAESIHGRFVQSVGGRVTPDFVLATSYDDLRSAGLSNAKALSIIDLANHVSSKSVDLKQIHKHSDEDVIDQLIQVRGIGRWTAEMFLMFSLGRLNIWPTGDYGVRKGWSMLHGNSDLITPKLLEVEGDKFHPYRSIVAWYCWRAVDQKL